MESFSTGAPKVLHQGIFLPLTLLGWPLGSDAGSPSLEWSNSALHLGKCCCLLPVGCVVMAGLLGWEGEEMGSLALIGSCGAAVKRPVRDMLPVSKCMGYMNIPRALWGQA